MKTRTQILSIGASALFLSLALITSNSDAAEANRRTHPSPQVQAKINNAMAGSYLYKNQNTLGKGYGDIGQDSCGSLQLGTIKHSRAARTDNTTVIRGDVININRNVRCR